MAGLQPPPLEPAAERLLWRLAVLLVLVHRQ